MASAAVITGKASATAAGPVEGVPDNVDPVYYAQLKFRRRQYVACIDICTALLLRNPYDRVSAQFLVARRAPAPRGPRVARSLPGCRRPAVFAHPHASHAPPRLVARPQRRRLCGFSRRAR